MSSINANAHIFWDTQWADPEARKSWQVPESRALHTIAKLCEQRAPDALRSLDLGCGAGRHILAMVTAGIESYGCDASTSSLDLVSEQLAQTSQVIRLSQANMTSLPYQDKFFDYVLSWNVLYHGSRQELNLAVSEVKRILSQGGLFEATFISKRNSNFGKGVEIDVHTWIDSSQDDKAHAHCYANKADLEEILDGLRIIEIEEYEQKNYAGAWHWYIKAQKD